MTEEQQKTLLQTVRANLERSENGDIKIMFDPNGDFEICERTEGKLIRYFTPVYVEGFDPYGQPKPSNNNA